jgi:hypothetical protein
MRYFHVCKNAFCVDECQGHFPEGDGHHFRGRTWQIYFHLSDDVTMSSQSDDEHLRHLKRVFEKCRKLGISLNPKKSLFGLEEGKILGHIISKDGIKIDPSKIKAIQKLEHPRNIKELKSFIGKINFLRRFIPNLAKLLINITNMLKKDTKIKWDTNPGSLLNKSNTHSRRP